ncbi:hypothetical protein BS333_08120 [Vibrio azureus]|uniref:DUF805 domain-containing protein n=1 Tax=Vibrio azureus NBRC 104587 TaxID=1219077 RepID=U3APX7_9VIBR|nr:DUF805 domain-containing protein [Vibrio azureus]AUI86357.1 hypothetical protein BS333_08120 [Vibrio azureus]GAD75332.1 hypothetical protein VAZ01S_024_00140 [Vibrio azureus NBRC 104587]
MIHTLFSFTGRINRTQYWIGQFYLLAQAILCFALLTKHFDTDNNTLNSTGLMIFFTFIVVCSCQSLAMSIKRYHDCNVSGRRALIALVPIIGILCVFIENGFLPGTKGDNQFGRMPK